MRSIATHLGLVMKLVRAEHSCACLNITPCLQYVQQALMVMMKLRVVLSQLMLFWEF